MKKKISNCTIILSDSTINPFIKKFDHQHFSIFPFLVEKQKEVAAKKIKLDEDTDDSSDNFIVKSSSKQKFSQFIGSDSDCENESDNSQKIENKLCEKLNELIIENRALRNKLNTECIKKENEWKKRENELIERENDLKIEIKAQRNEWNIQRMEREDAWMKREDEWKKEKDEWKKKVEEKLNEILQIAEKGNRHFIRKNG